MKRENIPDKIYLDLFDSFTENKSNNHFEGSTTIDSWIEQAEPKEVFEKYLEWNGIIGYDNLFDIAVALNKGVNT